MFESKALILELNARFQNAFATQDFEEALRLMLAQVKLDPEAEQAYSSISDCFREFPLQTLTALLKLHSAKGVATALLRKTIKTNPDLKRLKFTSQDRAEIINLVNDPTIAFSVGALWYPDHLQDIHGILSKFVGTGDFDLDLFEAFVAKELKLFDIAEEILIGYLSNKALPTRQQTKVRLLLSEVYLGSMRAEKAVDCLLKIKTDQASKGKTAALIYSYAHYSSEFDAQVPKKAAQLYEESIIPVPSLDTNTQMNHRERQKLRVGFISGSFRTHPVGWMMSGLLVENHQAPLFETFIFDTQRRDDFVAKTIQEVARENYFDLSQSSEKQILHAIKSSDLDILVDVEGLQPENMMHLAASLPKLKRVKWIGGMVNSTFMSFFDAIITDPYQTPLGTDDKYSEKVFRLPNAYVTYTPPPYRVEIAPPPCITNGFVTFGSMNNTIKLNKKTISLWSRILGQLPRSRIVFKDRGFASAFNQQLVKKWMAEEGVDPDIAEFVGTSDHQTHLGWHNRVDICLDPIPYAGGLCTLEAISMGTPVIGYAGEVIAHRHSVSHLTNVGHSELITNDAESYTQCAITLAKDPERIIKYAEVLRKDLMNSPLLDHKGFLREFSKILREIRESP